MYWWTKKKKGPRNSLNVGELRAIHFLKHVQGETQRFLHLTEMRTIRVVTSRGRGEDINRGRIAGLHTRLGGAPGERSKGTVGERALSGRH